MFFTMEARRTYGADKGLHTLPVRVFACLCG